MRFEGTLTVWNDERGFGRIESAQGGEPIFVHVSVWPRGSGRPRVSQLVSFEVELGAKGKRAKNVRMVRSQRAPAPARRRGPAQWGTATLFVLPVFLVVYAVVAHIGKLPMWVAGWYVLASAATFLAYAADKTAASKGAWRMAESSLHIFSLAGGWPGALVAQQFLRHKSSKREFRQVFWATVVLNCVALVTLAFSGMRSIIGAL